MIEKIDFVCIDTPFTILTMPTNDNDNDTGYIYCVSNESMPSILNIGITSIAPEVRLDDINSHTGLWRPPTPYKCEIAKRVRNIEKKKSAIDRLLTKYRIHPNREFYRISLEKAQTIFDLLDDETETAEKRTAEMKAFEERMLESMFQRCDALEAIITERKAELREINVAIEIRKNEGQDSLRPPYNFITEY